MTEGLKPRAGRQPLLEREGELAALDAALVAAVAGQGQVVVVEAPAGLGKTRLLDAAVEHARARGVEPLRARGSELERDFAFGVVRQLLEPALAARTPEQLERLFAGAAALARPLVESVPGTAGAASPADAPFSTLHGLYWLLSNLSDVVPLALAVDDAQWADAPTLRFLAFLHSRLAELRMTLIVCVRTGDPGVQRAPLAALVAASDAVAVQPAPLSAAAVQDLLRAVLDDVPPMALVAACHEVTAGNPFYLHALLRELSQQPVRESDALAACVRSLGPRAVSRSVLLRAAALAPAAPALARAAAVLGDGAALGEAAVLAQLDEREAAAIADLLIQAAVLKPRRRLEFVHPIVAESIYADIPPRERATQHARAAEVLAQAQARPERIAAQLLHSEPQGDEAAVAVLVAAAQHALGSGAPETAITFLQRALDEPPPVQLRPALLLQLGFAEFQDGRMAAVEHLAAVVESEADPAVRADAARLLARALAFSQRPHEAVATLQRAIDTVTSADRERTLELEAELIATGQTDVLPGEFVAERFRRLPLDEIRDGRTAGERQVLAVWAFQALRENRPAATVIELGRRALGGLHGPWPTYSLPSSMAVIALIDAGDHDFVTAPLEQMLADARTRGALTEFAAASFMLAMLVRARGDVREHEAHAEAAIAALGIPSVTILLVAHQVEALLERGDIAAAAGALERAGLAAAPPDQLPMSEPLFARGLVRGAQGDHAGALEDLLACGDRLVSTGSLSPAAIPWRSSAALAHLALGERDEAQRLANEEVALARAFEAPRPLGIALRAAGLTEGGPNGLDLLREAVTVLEPSGARLELARALVDLGSAVRRAGRRSEAAALLRRGHDLARECGGLALAERAVVELQATGARPRGRLTTGLEALTPSERRVAAMAADGLSNPQIAQALFVSLKTVETHLGHAYQKLGVRSRADLPDGLRTGSPG